MGIRSYAQNFEDVMLWRALSSVENGYFIDIGAQHPIKDSVSKAFSERGWRGIHVEPMPSFAAMLRENRPGDIVIQALISEHRGPATLYAIDGTGLSTGELAIADSHAANQFTYEPIVVPSLSLDELLSLVQDQDIHWLKIDVEGMEKTVLESWAISPQRPWIVVVEAHLPTSQLASHSQWENILIGKGYEHVYSDGLNRFYISSHQDHLIELFTYPPNIFDEFQLAENSDYTVEIRREAEAREEALRRDRDEADCRRIAAEKVNQLQGEAYANEISAQAGHFRAELARVVDANNDRERLSLELITTITQREERRTSDHHAQVAQLSAQISRQATYIDAITTSRSWHFAAPLRRLFREKKLGTPLPQLRLIPPLARQSGADSEQRQWERSQSFLPSASQEPIDMPSNITSLLASSTGDFVQQCYSLLLGRLPDPQEQNSRETALRTGFGRVRMLVDIERSDERAAHLHAQLMQGDDEEFISWAYLRYLGRPVEPEGLAHFLILLQRADRHKVRSDIITSKEARSSATLWSEINRIAVNEKKAAQWWRWRQRLNHRKRIRNIEREALHYYLNIQNNSPFDIDSSARLKEPLTAVQRVDIEAMGEHARTILRRIRALDSSKMQIGDTI